MQRNLLFAAILILVGLVIGLTMFMRGDSAPPPVGPGPAMQQPASSSAETLDVRTNDDAGVGAHARESVATGPGILLDDPEIRAGLCGFKGRVVDAKKQPVPDCGVRLYRGAIDTVLPLDVDLFAEQSDYEPQFIAGEVKTAVDGTWQLTGVWPRAFYMLLAGIGTDAPTHQIVTKTPSPGEIVDLGDIVLMEAGVITGTVLDDNGDPLAGALVRAADLPGTLAAFFPVERFDPEGAVLIREQSSPIRVLLMPKWVKRVFDSLPIPSTVSDSDGHFRLVGVVPGSNMLATTMRNFLSDVRPSIQVRAGQEKDVGRLKLKRGEELLGKVVDSAGKAVAGAEVLAGSTLTMAPIDLAQRLDVADAEGRFHGEGFSPGKVTVAARRDKGHAWVLAEPQTVLNEVVVVLPATFGVSVQVTLVDGTPVKEPRLKLLQGKAGNGAAEMSLLGFVPPVDLGDRLTKVADGQWRIEKLNPGIYTLLADAPGRAMAFTDFTIAEADAAVAVQLAEPNVFSVLVVDPQNQPIRNVAIYAESNGRRTTDMPLMVGRTDGLGRRKIDNLQAEKLRISGDHPKWGVVHGEAKLGEELVLVMQQPGQLVVTLVENGKPPAPAAFTVAVMPRGDTRVRGAIEDMPAMHTPGLDGSLTITAMQPGRCRVTAIKSLDTLRSPGGIFTMAQDMYLMRDMPNESCEITSGQTTEVVLQVGDKPLEGPTAQLSGSVTVEGRPGVDYIVTANARGHRFSAKVDARGRFDLGTVSAGDLNVSVMGKAEGGVFVGRGNDLWSEQLKLSQGEARDLTIDIVTTSMAGTCYLPDGSAAANVSINASGSLAGSQGQRNVWRNARTDANGAFRLDQIPAGTWHLRANLRGDSPARGELEGVQVVGGVPMESLRIDMKKTLVVKGRVDLAVLAGKQTQWAWVGFHRLSDTDGPEAQGTWADGVGIDNNNGSFESDELQPGRYRPVLYASLDNDSQLQFKCADVIVPPTGTDNLLILPGEKVK